MKRQRMIIIGTELLITLIFFVGAEWAGKDIDLLFHNYFADITIPFGFYLLLILVEDRVKMLRAWYSKAITVFVICSMSEILQYFGVYALASVFDGIDFLMYAIGVLLAAFVDTQIISKHYSAFHEN